MCCWFHMYMYITWSNTCINCVAHQSYWLLYGLTCICIMYMYRDFHILHMHNSTCESLFSWNYPSKCKAKDNPTACIPSMLLYLTWLNCTAQNSSGSLSLQRTQLCLLWLLIASTRVHVRTVLWADLNNPSSVIRSWWWRQIIKEVLKYCPWLGCRVSEITKEWFRLFMVLLQIYILLYVCTCMKVDCFNAFACACSPIA